MYKPSLNGRSLLSWLLAIAVPWIGGAGALVGVIALGRLAHQHLTDQGHIDFAAIECVPPEGMSRKDFLDQVQYYADLPDHLDVADDLVKKLLQAFVLHPWVERVEGITRLPENRVRVKLLYRTPALTVEVNGHKRAVDGHGVLLPSDAPTTGLPILRLAKAPTWGRDGTLLGDDRVQAASRTAAFLREQQPKLRIKEIAGTSQGLLLKTEAEVEILWGHPPGSETGQEISAERKRERLLDADRHSGKIDLRGGDGH